jgi:hypothetical protein
MTKRVHIARTGRHDSGGEHETKHTARRMHKGMKPHSPGVADRQAPHKQRAIKELKHIDQGDLVNSWCLGKRKGYK